MKVWICYLGVNLLGTGLHRYGGFQRGGGHLGALSQLDELVDGNMASQEPKQALFGNSSARQGPQPRTRQHRWR